jgi:hypothetical protein
MTSYWQSLIPFLPFPAAANSEDSTQFSSDYCSVLLHLLNSQFQFSNLIFKTGYRLRAAAACSCSCALNSFVCLPCSCPASKRSSRVRLLIDAVPVLHFVAKGDTGQRTAPICLDTRQVGARQCWFCRARLHDIDFSRQINELGLARQPR